MKKTNFDFPHPVLFEGNDDYINSVFSITAADVSEDGQDFRLLITYTLTSSGLNDLVGKNKAAVVVKIESSFASFRRIEIFDCDKTQKEITIKRNLVAKDLVIAAQIVANEKIDNFLLDEHNKDYFTVPYTIEIGEVLAYEPGHKLYLDASELERPVSSIITIAENDFSKDYIIVDLNDDHKIKVFLDKDSYEAYWNLRAKQELKKYVAGVVVMPALNEAVDKIKSNLHDGESDQLLAGKTWYRVIKKKILEKGIKEEDIPFESSVKLSNVLLGNIINSSLLSLDETFAKEFDGTNLNVMGGND